MEREASDSLSNESADRFNIGHILAKGASRKHYFTGNVKKPMSPSKKYAHQATPISEES
jgi:hypothetical protein